jgi:hypothetical protein
MRVVRRLFLALAGLDRPDQTDDVFVTICLHLVYPEIITLAYPSGCKLETGGEKMKTSIYIILTRTHTILSTMIHYAKGDEYTHASISLDRDLNTMYSFGRKYALNPFIGGFKMERLNEGVYQFCRSLPGRVIEVEVTPEQYNQAVTLLKQFVDNRSRYQYNYSGLFNSLVNRASYDQNHFLCSEFVYYVLQKIGAADFKLPRNLVRPQSFIQYLNGRTVYQGDLKVLSVPANARRKDVAVPLWHRGRV